MTRGPFFATRARGRACWPIFYSTSMYAVTCDIVVNQVGTKSPLAAGWLTYEYTQLGSCHGPAGGAPAAGVGGGVPTERIPRDKPPNPARRGEVVTKTQELRPALSWESRGYISGLYCLYGLINSNVSTELHLSYFVSKLAQYF
jgi:hypothetical protein